MRKKDQQNPCSNDHRDIESYALKLKEKFKLTRIVLVPNY